MQQKSDMSKNFIIYQSFVFRLLQGEVLKPEEQSELIAIQKKSELSKQLEELFLLNCSLNYKEKEQLIREIKKIKIFTNYPEIQPFLNKLKLPEASYKKIPYGSSPLAILVKEFRRKWQNNLDNNLHLNTNFNNFENDCFQCVAGDFKPTDARNIALIEFLNPENEQNEFLMRISNPITHQHAEELLIDALKTRFALLKEIKFIKCYSELQPCDSDNHNNSNKLSCRDLLLKEIPQVQVEFTFDYSTVDLKNSEKQQFSNFLKAKQF